MLISIVKDNYFSPGMFLQNFFYPVYPVSVDGYKDIGEIPDICIGSSPISLTDVIGDAILKSRVFLLYPLLRTATL